LAQVCEDYADYMIGSAVAQGGRARSFKRKLAVVS
jgi:hypothetical protein